MKLRSVKLDKKYIPEFNGNKELPEDQQVTVEIKEHLSNAQLAQYRKFVFRQGATMVEYDDVKMMAFHVGKITNLEDDNGPIRNGAELADSKNTQLYDLMVELRNYLLNAGEAIPEGEN